MIISDKNKLSGTCYFELLPGPYEGKCWGDNSVFISEEIFGLIEPIFEKHIPNFDHFSFMQVERNIWIAIIRSLKKLAEDLENWADLKCRQEVLTLWDEQRRVSFEKELPDSVGNLLNLVQELVIWSEKTLKVYPLISVLGL